MKSIQIKSVASFCVLSLVFLNVVAAPSSSRRDENKIKSIVEKSAQPLMDKYEIPGMAIGVISGNKSWIVNLGVSSLNARNPIDDQTLFELGSVSKIFNVTLAALAEKEGHLSLNDPAEKYLPQLSGTDFGKVKIFNLGTHTVGGIELQFPDEVKSEQDMMTYYRSWKPKYGPMVGMPVYRTYANPSIGLLGYITARSWGEKYEKLVAEQILKPLKMKHTFYKVAQENMKDYAQGYTSEGQPIRLAGGVLDSEAYGVRSTASDMLQMLKANMGMIPLPEKLQAAFHATQIGYYQVGAMTQDLIWEQYAYPADLEVLRSGNGSSAIKPTQVTELNPPLPPMKNVFINKTGSTNGFSSYLAFVPEKKIGIVMLANKRISNEDRVSFAHQVLSGMTSLSR